MRRTIFSACLALAVFVPTMLEAAPSGDDQAMAQRIGSQLKQSGRLHDYRIGVKYQDGIAWLSGTVASNQQSSTAARLTRSVSGIDHVVNRLTVSGSSATGVSFEAVELGKPLQQAGQESMQFRSVARQQRQTTQPPPARKAFGQPAKMKAARIARRSNQPLPMGARPVRQALARNYAPMQAQYAGGQIPQAGAMSQGPTPAGYVPGGHTRAVSYDNAQMPGYAWPSYSSYPNYGALSYPKQYSPSAWPYIGPFYPYPQVPLGWRKISLEWDDGWWFLDFSDVGSNH